VAGPANHDARSGPSGYHPQDEAFLSWFAHQTPSIGYGGPYSYLGSFTSPSTLC